MGDRHLATQSQSRAGFRGMRVPHVSMVLTNAPAPYIHGVSHVLLSLGLYACVPVNGPIAMVGLGNPFMQPVLPRAAFEQSLSMFDVAE